jgi:hypothetical protein
MNPVYVGQVKYKQERDPGEHAAIVDAEQWQEVQALLSQQGAATRAGVRSPCPAPLRGLLRRAAAA